MSENPDKGTIQALASEVRVLNLVIQSLMKKNDELEVSLEKSKKLMAEKDTHANMFKWRNGNLKKEIGELERKVARKTEIINRDQALSLFDAKQHVLAEIGGWLQALSEIENDRRT